MIKHIRTHDVLETEAFAGSFAQELLEDKKSVKFIALYGDLGVGKTAFVRGFTSKVVPDARVKSPTFAVVREYRGKPLSVFHFDMYRIESEDELYAIGFDDYLNRPGFCILEWSEKVPFALPSVYYEIRISKVPDNENDREIVVKLVGKE